MSTAKGKIHNLQGVFDFDRFMLKLLDFHVLFSQTLKPLRIG